MTEPKIVRPEDVDPHHDWSRPLMALGSMGVDFEERVDFRPLHRYRLCRAPSARQVRSRRHPCFDQYNIRYMSSTVSGDWAVNRRLAPAEYQGGVSVVSNLGGHRVREFSAIIDPPHATILVAGSIERRPPETEDGGFEFTSRMTVTLSSDQPHRRRRGRRRTARQGFIEAPVRIVV